MSGLSSTVFAGGGRSLRAVTTRETAALVLVAVGCALVLVAAGMFAGVPAVLATGGVLALLFGVLLAYDDSASAGPRPPLELDGDGA